MKRFSSRRFIPKNAFNLQEINFKQIYKLMWLFCTTYKHASTHIHAHSHSHSQIYLADTIADIITEIWEHKCTPPNFKGWTDTCQPAIPKWEKKKVKYWQKQKIKFSLVGKNGSIISPQDVFTKMSSWKLNVMHFKYWVSFHYITNHLLS